MMLSELIRMRKWAKKNSYQIIWDSNTNKWGAAKNGDSSFPVSPFFKEMNDLQKYLVHKMHEDKVRK